MSALQMGSGTLTFNGAAMPISGYSLAINGASTWLAEPEPEDDPDRVRPSLGDALSSCPFKPGTGEWKQWQQDYLAINPSSRTSAPDEFDRNVEERELGRMLAASRLPVERVTYLNQQMREAREAIDQCGPERNKRSPYVYWTSGDPLIAGHTYTVSWTWGATNVQPHVIHTYYNGMWAGGPLGICEPALRPEPTASRHKGSKRRRRPVAAAARDCRHGNPSNHCRDCSMGRR